MFQARKRWRCSYRPCPRLRREAMVTLVIFGDGIMVMILTIPQVSGKSHEIPMKIQWLNHPQMLQCLEIFPMFCETPGRERAAGLQR